MNRYKITYKFEYGKIIDRTYFCRAESAEKAGKMFIFEMRMQAQANRKRQILPTISKIEMVG
jgi:hypothetical protein